MVLILLNPAIPDTPFRAHYVRLTARGKRPAKAIGHVGGKLSAVLYSMLKTMTLYDEVKHRQALGLPGAEGTVCTMTVEAPFDLLTNAGDNDPEHRKDDQRKHHQRGNRQ